MKAAVFTNNDPGYSCYGCGNEPTMDMFVFRDFSGENEYLCSECLVSRLVDGSLTLTEGDGSCNDCGNTIPINNDTYCQSCYDRQYTYGEENAVSTCDECGDDSAVYCKDHAKEVWELNEYSDIMCDGCSKEDSEGSTDFHYLCDECYKKVAIEAVTVAQAAEPIEVTWE